MDGLVVALLIFVLTSQWGFSMYLLKKVSALDKKLVAVCEFLRSNLGWTRRSG